MRIIFIILALFISVAYAKKFLIKKGDIIDGVLNVGIVLPANQQPQQNQASYRQNTENEPPQVYPISITLTSNDFKNCNAVGELIYNPQLDRFYGNISKISCNENNKIKDYSTKGYILDKNSIIGLDKSQTNPNTPVKIMIVEDIK